MNEEFFLLYSFINRSKFIISKKIYFKYISNLILLKENKFVINKTSAKRKPKYKKKHKINNSNNNINKKNEKKNKIENGNINNSNNNNNNNNNQKQNDNKDNKDNNNFSNNNINKNTENLRRNFINEDFYNKFLKNDNISTNEIDILNVIGDGNCLMRCFALFVYKNENEHFRIRNEIASYLLTHYQEYENTIIPTEEGEKGIMDYINYIRLPGK